MYKKPIHGYNCGAKNLQVISRTGSEMDQTVVRWCSKCGAVVVDLDSDGRTSPGAVKVMMYPEGKC